MEPSIFDNGPAAVSHEIRCYVLFSVSNAHCQTTYDPPWLVSPHHHHPPPSSPLELGGALQPHTHTLAGKPQLDRKSKSLLIIMETGYLTMRMKMWENTAMLCVFQHKRLFLPLQRSLTFPAFISHEDNTSLTRLITDPRKFSFLHYKDGLKAKVLQVGVLWLCACPKRRGRSQSVSISHLQTKLSWQPVVSGVKITVTFRETKRFYCFNIFVVQRSTNLPFKIWVFCGSPPFVRVHSWRVKKKKSGGM